MVTLNMKFSVVYHTKGRNITVVRSTISNALSYALRCGNPRILIPTESSNYTKLHNICALRDLELENDDLFEWASASTHSHQFLNNIMDGWNKMHTNYTRSHSLEEFGNDVSCALAIGFCERISYILLHHKYCVQMCNIQWIQCLSESSMSYIIPTAIISWTMSWMIATRCTGCEPDQRVWKS